MIPAIHPYPAYKPSDVPWLGDVPAHWEVRRLRTIANVANGATPSTSVDSYWDGTILWVTPEDLGKLSSRYVVASGRRITEDGYQACGTTLAPAGSVAISTRAPIGHLGILAEAGCVNQGCRLLAPSAVQPEYLHYALATCRENLAVLGQGSTFTELSGTQLSDFRLPLPPLREQQAIVRYLDYVDRRIRRYVAAKRKLIALLEEEKQAIVNRAVTRGLDPNVRLKPSGAEWLGEVPEHWAIVRLSSASRPKSIANQQHRELLSVYLNLGVVRFSDIDERRTNPTSQDLSHYQAVDPSDLVLNNQQAWRGSVGVSNLEGIVSPAYLVLELSRQFDPKFADLLFRDKSMVAQYLICSKGVGTIQRNLYWPHLKGVLTLVPPLVEQSAIVDHLGEATTDIDAAIVRARRQVELVLEYRTRLIADVVTGKLAVREAAAQMENPRVGTPG